MKLDATRTGKSSSNCVPGDQKQRKVLSDMIHCNNNYWNIDDYKDGGVAIGNGSISQTCSLINALMNHKEGNIADSQHKQ